ncbi:MAG: hypothetical protein IJC81_04880, partial [Clostridia bacterium]|nr:hypothetical protein [Clostridia bacterium]
MKKRVLLIISLVLIALFIVSCGKKEETGAPLVNNDPKNNAIIPADLNVSGDFHILVAGYKVNDFAGDAEASTNVEYASYQRNEWLRAYYGLNITTDENLGYGNTNGTGTGFQKIYTDYMSGNSTYDAAMIGGGDV